MTASRLGASRVLLLVVVLAVLAGGAALAWYADTYLPYWHFRTVKEGAFYRTSQLDGEQLAEAITDYGIRTIINLRDVGERQNGDWYEVEARVAAEKGVRLLDVPLKAGTAPSPDQVAVLLELMDAKENLPVLVHCYHGSIRSAAAEGLFRREYLGETGEQAYDRVESWSRDLEADYPLIAKFIREYVPRRDRKAKAPAD